MVPLNAFSIISDIGIETIKSQYVGDTVDFPNINIRQNNVMIIEVATDKRVVTLPNPHFLYKIVKREFATYPTTPPNIIASGTFTIPN